MQLRTILFLTFFFSVLNTGFSQLEKVIHQTFDPGTIQNIKIDLIEGYELLPWSGNQILTETEVELYDAAPHVLDFFHRRKKSIRDRDPGRRRTNDPSVHRSKSSPDPL